MSLVIEAAKRWPGREGRGRDQLETKEARSSGKKNRQVSIQMPMRLLSVTRAMMSRRSSKREPRTSPCPA